MLGGAELADLIPDSVLVRSADGDVLAWNMGAEHLYGWTAAQAIGRSADELLASNHPFGLDFILGEITARGEWRGEMYRRTVGGRDLCVRVRCTGRRDESGALAEIVEWSRDAEEVSAGEVAEHRFTKLFHAMAASFWELDFSEVRKAIGGLVAAGVSDIPGRLRSDRDFIDRAIEMVRVIDVNEQTMRLFGMPSLEDVPARSIGWAWPEQSRHVFAESLIAAAQRRDSYSTETVLRRMDGQLIDVLFTVCWPSDHKAQGTVLVGVVDITDRKRAEKALQASERRYRNLFEFLPIAVWQMNGRALRDKTEALAAQGQLWSDHVRQNPDAAAAGLMEVTEVNDQLLKLFDLTDREAAMGPLANFWSDKAGIVDFTDRRMRGADHMESEVRLKTAKGRAFDALVTVAFPDAMEDDAVSLAAAIDITDRKRAFQEVEASEHRYRDLFQHVPVALVQLNMQPLFARLDGLQREGIEDLASYVANTPNFIDEVLQLSQILEANAEALRLFGVDDVAQIRGPIGWGWKTRPETIRRSLTARLRGETQFSEETQIDRPDGAVVDVLYAMSFPGPLMERGINVVGFVDISARKQADLALREAETRLQKVHVDLSHAARVSTLGELTASIAHEVNQPLAAISAFGEASLRWLRRDTPDLQEVETLTQDIIADARRASDIIARVRGMAIKQEPTQGQQDIAALIEEAMLIVRHESQAKGVSIQLSLDGGLPSIMADKVQLQQVIVNLSVNAIQAMGEQPPSLRTLHVHAQRLGCGHVEVRFDDSGPGIAPEHLDQLFDGFFTTKQGGMGMGLAICRSIIQAHGGQIAASNHGNGARFAFTLPYLDRAAA